MMATGLNEKTVSGFGVLSGTNGSTALCSMVSEKAARESRRRAADRLQQCEFNC